MTDSRSFRAVTDAPRAGFTLVELLIVSVLGAMVLMATYQVLITNQRTYSVEQARIQAQQNIRAGVEVLFAELREVSPRGGDLISFGIDSLQVRVARTYGVACSVNLTGTPTLVVGQVGSWFATTTGGQDSVFVFADVDTAKVSDDMWHVAAVNAGATTATCGSRAAQTLSFPGYGPTFRRDTVWPGAPVRQFRWYTYGLYTVDGKYYLGRHEPTGSVVPLVGPLAADGLTFRYLDSNGDPTATGTDVRQIEISMKSPSEIRGPNGEFVVDSLTTRIYTRN